MKKTPSESPAGPVMRADIEQRFRNNLNMTVFGAKAMAAAILDIYCRHLVSGNTIEMRTVGKIESRYRSPRRHHLVTEGRTRMTPAHRVLRFSPSQKLRARMLEHHRENDAGDA